MNHSFFITISHWPRPSRPWFLLDACSWPDIAFVTDPRAASDEPPVEATASRSKVPARSTRDGPSPSAPTLDQQPLQLAAQRMSPSATRAASRSASARARAPRGPPSASASARARRPPPPGEAHEPLCPEEAAAATEGPALGMQPRGPRPEAPASPRAASARSRLGPAEHYVAP